ncbi:hypothetical protein JT358_15980 [Micrococcales bacterium 31B]|nr:hypothetical protein [Micrococcales bacterium 31B]
MKTANRDTIYAVTNAAGTRGTPITFEQWRAADFPTPKTVAVAPTR